MAGMDAGPGSDLGGLGWFAATWALMMAAMMPPAVAPMVAAYRGRTAGLGATPAFAAGYLIAWLVAGLLGYVLVEGSARSTSDSSPGTRRVATWREA
jgi:predicted metal-binding membrane protein